MDDKAKDSPGWLGEPKWATHWVARVILLLIVIGLVRRIFG